MPLSKPFLPARILLGLTLFGVAVCGPLLAQAATLYVATPQSVPAGNDATGDGTATKPYATIAKALSRAAAGDLVSIGDGTYATGQLSIPVRVSLVGQSQNSANVKVVPNENLGLDQPLFVLASDTLNTDGNQSMAYLDASGLNGGFKASRALLVRNRNQVEIHHCSFHDFYTDRATVTSEQSDHAFKIESTQIGNTQRVWCFFPTDLQDPGINTNLDAGVAGIVPADNNCSAPGYPARTKYAWPINPVKNFSFHHNTLLRNYPINLYNLKDSSFTFNHIDNRGVGCWAFKGTTAFVDHLAITDNFIYGDDSDESGQTPWKVELWGHRGGCDYSRNTMNGYFSLTYGKETKICSNTIIKDPLSGIGTGNSAYGTGIEANNQSHAEIYENFLYGSGAGIYVGSKTDTNANTWLTKNITVRNNVMSNLGQYSLSIICTGGYYANNLVDGVYAYHNVIDSPVVDPEQRGSYGFNVREADTPTGTGTLQNIYIKNNIVARQNTLAVYVIGTPENFVISHNQFFDNGNDGCSYGTPLFTSTSDPLFINPGLSFAGYALKTTPVLSPCINSGTPVGLPFNGSAPDRGAIETGSTSPAPLAPRGLTVR